MKDAVILDSSGFYSGLAFSMKNFYTTKGVLKEISHIKLSKLALESLLEQGLIKVDEGKKEHFKKVIEVAKRSGDFKRLSKTDLSLLALALKLKDENFDSLIVSDDYSLCNVAKLLNLKVTTSVTRGITKVIRWIVYCKSCKKVFGEYDVKVCDVCGSPLARKPRGKLKKKAKVS